MFFVNSVEFRFFEPARDTKIGSKNQTVQEIGGKITVLDRECGTSFGSSYWKV